MPITTTPSGGPQGEYSTYTPISSQTLSSAASSVTFSNIPLFYTDLIVVLNASVTASDNELFCQVGNTSVDATSNYSSTFFFGDGGTPLTTRQSNSYANLGRLVVNSSQPSATSTIHFMNYSNPTTYKTIIDNCGSASTYIYQNVSTWRNTSPITQIKLYPSQSTFIAGSTFTIYGVKAAATQFIPTKAAGGDIVVSDGTYAYHVFRTSGTFAPAQSLSCDYLVVAGGGGGGGLYHGAGGGAGGLRAILAQTVNSSTTVTVGAGGAGGSGAAAANIGGSGTNTSFGSYAVSGGGGGGSTRGDTVPFAAGNGGSGGGSTGYSTTLYGTGNTGGYTPVEGYRGGAGGNGGNYGAGGGGGAGGIGTAGTTSAGGAGGPGLNTYNSINFSSWLTATGTGSGGYLAGGGGGSSYSTGAYGVGGVGGGGNGSNQVSGTFEAIAGVINTGGGGGGSERSGSASGAAGGSGIVIVRYAL